MRPCACGRVRTRASGAGGAAAAGAREGSAQHLLNSNVVQRCFLASPPEDAWGSPCASPARDRQFSEVRTPAPRPRRHPGPGPCLPFSLPCPRCRPAWTRGPSDRLAGAGRVRGCAEWDRTRSKQPPFQTSRTDGLWEVPSERQTNSSTGTRTLRGSISKTSQMGAPQSV